MDLICSRKDANACRVLESKQMGEILCFIFLAASRENLYSDDGFLITRSREEREDGNSEWDLGI